MGTPYPVLDCIGVPGPLDIWYNVCVLLSWASAASDLSPSAELLGLTEPFPLTGPGEMLGRLGVPLPC